MCSKDFYAYSDTTNIIIEVTTGLTKNMAVTTTDVMSTEEITSNLLTTTTDVTDTPAVTAKGMDLYLNNIFHLIQKLP